MESPHSKAPHLIEINPHHDSLHLNALKGRLGGLHVASVNMKFRITLEMIISDKNIIPINLGDLNEVYG